jgi:ribosomal protein S18 acetylase RimI-like enzyme
MRKNFIILFFFFADIPRDFLYGMQTLDRPAEQTDRTLAQAGTPSILQVTSAPTQESESPTIELFHKERDYADMVEVQSPSREFVPLPDGSFLDRTIKVLRLHDITIGYVSYEVIDSEAAYIQALAIAPSHQKKGYGKRLLAHAIDELKKSGVTSVELCVNRNNKNARNFYTHMGFEEKPYRNPHYSLVSMILHFSE